MKIKIVQILSVLLFLVISSCSMDTAVTELKEDNNSSRVITGILPVTTNSKCYNNTCYRYNTELTGVVRVLSSSIKTMKITNGHDCPKCNFYEDHNVTYKHVQLLKKCVSCGYQSGANKVITVLSCELQAPVVTRITGFKVEPHPYPSAPVEYAIWNPVPNAEKYVVTTYSKRPGYPSTTNTSNYTQPKVGLYKPHNSRVLSIKAYNSRNQLLATYN